MNGKIKPAFDGIHAEEKLKENTLKHLREEILHRGVKQNRVTFKRYAAAFASVAVILFSSAITLGLYFTPIAYVDVDVNPSVEITVNRFDRVINTYAYNSEGNNLLENADVTHMNYKEAVGILVDVMVKDGYTREDSLISVTLQANNGDKESAAMLSGIESAVLEHHGSAQVEAFSVAGEVRNTAHELNLSPAKYLAIQDLMEIDPAVTVDSCREHSISEIKQLTDEHSTNHHGTALQGEAPESGSTTPPAAQSENNGTDAPKENKVHGGNHH